MPNLPNISEVADVASLISALASVAVFWRVSVLRKEVSRRASVHIGMQKLRATQRNLERTGGPQSVQATAELHMVVQILLRQIGRAEPEVYRQLLKLQREIEEGGGLDSIRSNLGALLKGMEMLTEDYPWRMQ